MFAIPLLSDELFGLRGLQVLSEKNGKTEERQREVDRDCTPLTLVDYSNARLARVTRVSPMLFFPLFLQLTLVSQPGKYAS